MKSDNTFINSLCGAQPPVTILYALSTEEVTAVCVCVFADVHVPFQYMFMLVFEEEEAFKGANVDAAGRLYAHQTPAHNTTQSLLLRVAWQSLK